MWDELAAAAWLDPSVITKQETRYLSVDINQGPGYGNTVTWTDGDKPKTAGPPVTIHVDLDKEKFYEMFVRLMSAQTELALSLRSNTNCWIWERSRSSASADCFGNCW